MRCLSFTIFEIFSRFSRIRTHTLFGQKRKKVVSPPPHLIGQRTEIRRKCLLFLGMGGKRRGGRRINSHSKSYSDFPEGVQPYVSSAPAESRTHVFVGPGKGCQQPVDAQKVLLRRSIVCGKRRRNAQILQKSRLRPVASLSLSLLSVSRSTWD